MKSSGYLSPFINYLADCSRDGERLPPLADLAQELGISIAKLREQLEVAREIGVVDIHPKTGIHRVAYTFKPSVLSGLTYATKVSPEYFQAYSDLRRHIEAGYWREAVARLTQDDHQALKDLVGRASEKLSCTPPQIPQQEHRELHLIMYRRLGNIFVTGLLEAFWEIYEIIGLDIFMEMEYLQRVWNYHQKIVDAICLGDFDAGYQALLEHMDLLNQRPKSQFRQSFE